MKFKTYASKNTREDMKRLINFLYYKDLNMKVFFADPEKSLKELVMGF